MSNIVALNNGLQQVLVPAEDDSYQEFYRDFEIHLGELQNAIKRTKNVEQLAKSLSGRSGISNVLGSITGRNDKELADMIGDLGASVEITQVVLQLLMRVQNVRNGYLKDFYDRLVAKISMLENDDKTLDKNQRQAATAIVSELCNRVAFQIKQQDLIDDHEKKLNRLDGFVSIKDDLDAKQDEKIDQLESRSMDIILSDREQQRLIEELQRNHASKDELDAIQTQRIDMLMTEFARLESSFDRHGKIINLLESQSRLLIKRIKLLEEKSLRPKSIYEILFRDVLPVVALCMATASLWSQFH
jgi:hypothetical protein